MQKMRHKATWEDTKGRRQEKLDAGLKGSLGKFVVIARVTVLVVIVEGSVELHSKWHGKWLSEVATNALWRTGFPVFVEDLIHMVQYELDHQLLHSHLQESCIPIAADCLNLLWPAWGKRGTSSERLAKTDQISSCKQSNRHDFPTLAVHLPLLPSQALTLSLSFHSFKNYFLCFLCHLCYFLSWMCYFPHLAFTFFSR